MAISSMRWRAASALITAGTAAAAVLALAVPAGASTGTAEISPEQAGYTATGAQFRSIRAQVFLRQPGQYSGQVASFGQSVQLWSSGLVVTVGVRASTSGTGSYIPYATIYNRSTHQVIASNPNAQSCDPVTNHCSDPQPYNPGTEVMLEADYNSGIGRVDMEVIGVGSGQLVFDSYLDGVTPQSFTQARVGTEFGASPWDGSFSYTPPAQYTKGAAYSEVGLVTYSDHESSLWSWWVHHPLLANTEQQSGSDWVAIPTNLTNGGASFQTFFVPQSGQGRAQPVLP
jgi:hypothetical protein